MAETTKKSTLQALLVLLLVLSLVAGVFSAYFFVYTASNEIYLQQRNYRVLATIARQISARIEGIDKAWENIVDGCKQAKQPSLSDCVDRKLERIPELSRIDCPARAQADRAWVVAHDGDMFFSQKLFCVKARLGELARTSLAETFFDDYVVTDDAGGILFRQQDRWGDAQLEDPVGFTVREPQLEKRAAENYLRFSQPMRVALDGVRLSWWIHGQVQGRKFQSQVWQVSPTIVSGLVVLIATLLLGWPIFKLWLLGPREMFQTIDVYALTISCLLGAGLLAAYGLDTYAFRAIGAQRFDASLRDLADKIVANFYDETDRGQAILTEFAKNPGSPIAPATLKTYAYAELYRASSTGEINQRWTVLSVDGKEPELKSAESITNVADRSYFRHAQEGRLFWRFKAATGFAAEMVRSRLDGQLTFVLAVPTAASAQKPPNEREVALISIPLISLIDAVMPFGYGFAVVDQRGDVILHRQQQRSGQENIIEECEGDSRLAAALETQRELFTSIRYYGRPHQFYVRPLPNTPWSLIVFRNREPLQTTNAAILQVAIALFVIYLAVPALFLAVLQLGGRYQSEWLWPRREYTDVYALGSVALLCEVVVLFGVLDYAHAWPRFLLLAAVPAQCWCFLYLLLAAPDSPAQRRVVVGGLTASSALIVAAASMSRYPGLSVALAVAVVVVCLGVAIIAQRRRDSGVRRDERVFRAAYASLLTMACVTVAVGPATLLFRDVFDQGMTGFIRYGQFRHVDALIQRADQVYKLYRDKHLTGGTPQDRLKTNLDVYTVPLYGTPSGPSSAGGTPHGRGPAPYLSQAMFPLLPSHQPAVGRIGLLAGSVADHGLATWKSERNGSRSLHLEITDAALTDRLRDVDPSLLRLRADLFGVLPNALDTRMLGFVLAWALGIGALALLIAAITRRVFLLDADAGLAVQEVSANGAPVLATWVAVHRAKQSGEGIVVVDLSAVHQASDCASLFRNDAAPQGESKAEGDERKGDSPPGIALIAHLGTRSGDREWTEAKLALIERLLFEPPFADRVSVVLLSPIDLMRLWVTAPKPPLQVAPGATASASAEEGAARRWAELMRSFTSEWIQLPHSEAYFAEVLDASRSQAVKEASLPFAEAWGSTASYHDAWSTSSLEEKLALVHLASEGFLNPGMLDAVTHLIQRGVVIRDPALRFVDPGFAKYVVAAQDDPSLVDWRATAPRGDWERLRVPGMILLAVVIAFLYTTQRGVWDSTSALIAAVSGGIPTLLKFLGLFKNDGGAAGQSGSRS